MIGLAFQLVFAAAEDPRWCPRAGDRPRDAVGPQPDAGLARDAVARVVELAAAPDRARPGASTGSLWPGCSESFRALPVGAPMVQGPALAGLVELGIDAFVVGVRLGTPVRRGRPRRAGRPRDDLPRRAFAPDFFSVGFAVLFAATMATLWPPWTTSAAGWRLTSPGLPASYRRHPRHAAMSDDDKALRTNRATQDSIPQGRALRPLQGRRRACRHRRGHGRLLGSRGAIAGETQLFQASHGDLGARVRGQPYDVLRIAGGALAALAGPVIVAAASPPPSWGSPRPACTSISARSASGPIGSTSSAASSSSGPKAGHRRAAPGHAARRARRRMSATGLGRRPVGPAHPHARSFDVAIGRTVDAPRTSCWVRAQRSPPSRWWTMARAVSVWSRI